MGLRSGLREGQGIDLNPREDLKSVMILARCGAALSSCNCQLRSGCPRCRCCVAHGIGWSSKTFVYDYPVTKLRITSTDLAFLQIAPTHALNLQHAWLTTWLSCRQCSFTFRHTRSRPSVGRNKKRDSSVKTIHIHWNLLKWHRAIANPSRTDRWSGERSSQPFLVKSIPHCVLTLARSILVVAEWRSKIDQLCANEGVCDRLLHWFFVDVWEIWDDQRFPV